MYIIIINIDNLKVYSINIDKLKVYYYKYRLLEGILL